MNIYQQGFREFPEFKTLKSLNSSTTANSWYYGQITIENDFSEPDYKILVEGIVGAGMQGNIAIDDAKFSDGSCQPPPNECIFQCSNSSCISETKFCNFIDDCNNGEEEIACGYNTDIENDTGGWLEVSDGAFKWIRSKGGNPLTNTGPSIGNKILNSVQVF